MSTLRNDWNFSMDTHKPMYFVTWGSTIVPSDQTELKRSFGRPLGPIADDDFKEIVRKGLISFGKIDLSTLSKHTINSVIVCIIARSLA